MIPRHASQQKTTQTGHEELFQAEEEMNVAIRSLEDLGMEETE